MSDMDKACYYASMIHKAKKSLGQNFLKSEQALRTMCEAGSVTHDDIVVEIGPGKGALTIKLLEKSGKVIAIEKDRDLVDFLKEKFSAEIQEKKLVLIEGDCLEFSPQEYGLKPHMYKLIANIPYNITGAIFRKFLEEDIQPKTMVLLVQKEVAKRIVASDKKESILSLSVKVYGTPKYILKVPKRFFSPAPKVDSAIVAITDISRDHFKTRATEQAFFKLIHAGFAHKRKVLRKNLEEIASKENIADMFGTLTLPTAIRAEDTTLELFLSMNDFLLK